MQKLASEQIATIDQSHIWHPYSAKPDLNPLYVAESAEGCRINLADGRSLIDGMSSWWTAIHGYSHPELVSVAKEQVSCLSHLMFGGFMAVIFFTFLF